MLSDSNIAKINRQIRDELRIVESRVLYSDEEKAAALDRIMKMKQILSDTPAPVEKDEDSTDDLAASIRDLIHAFKRR